MNTDMFLIDAKNFPLIFSAFEVISHDSGNQAGHTNYAMPRTYEDKATVFESQLRTLHAHSDTEFEILCIGEELEKREIVEKYGLKELDDFLQAFFEEL